MTTLSLLTPSGRLTLGNLLGALRPMAQRQEDAYYGLSDLHAMTTAHQPALLRERSREMATLLLAVGWTAARCSGRATSRPTPRWRSCWSARRTPGSSTG